MQLSCIIEPVVSLPDVTMTATSHLFALLVGAALIPTPAAWAQGHKAHQHGIVQLDIGVERDTLALELEMPLDSLVGFERAPRTDAERERVKAAVQKLRAADQLFKPDPAAGCTLEKVTLTSAVLGLNDGAGAAPAGAAKPSEHADLEASVSFRCKDGAKLSFVDVSLQDAFKQIGTVRVQVAAPAGQFSRELKGKNRRVSWAKP